MFAIKYTTKLIKAKSKSATSKETPSCQLQTNQLEISVFVKENKKKCFLKVKCEIRKNSRSKSEGVNLNRYDKNDARVTDLSWGRGLQFLNFDLFLCSVFFIDTSM